MLIRNLRYLIRSEKRFSTVTAEAAAASQKFEDFRTNEDITANHSAQHIGKFYRIDPDIKKQIFAHGGIPKSYEKQIKTFGEACLMVREPAVEIMHYIKNSNISKKACIRYVLFGEDGVGKSLTMAHLLNFAHQEGFVLVHVPWVPNWFKKPKEIVNSTTDEGFIDLPFDAAAWLIHFKTQNAAILPKLDLKLSRDYVWSKRETTPAGATLIELIEHGIARIKFATGTIKALLTELKEQSTAGKVKTFVAIDGYNAFFHPHTRIVADNKAKITPDKITLTQPFIDITNYDWSNGVCVLIADRMALTEGQQESYMPVYQIGPEGFEHLNPFVPIHVEKYTEKEYQSCISYYVDRKWIQNTEKGFEQELKFLSGCNPYKLMNICAPL